MWRARGAAGAAGGRAQVWRGVGVGCGERWVAMSGSGGSGPGDGPRNIPTAERPSGNGVPSDGTRKETQPRYGGSGPGDGPRTVTPAHRPSGSGGPRDGPRTKTQSRYGGNEPGDGARLHPLLRVPPDWLLCVCHLADLAADGYRALPTAIPIALLLVSRGVRERLLELASASVANRRRSRATLYGLYERLGIYSLRCEPYMPRRAWRLLSRFTPERLAAKRWHHMADRMFLPRAVIAKPVLLANSIWRPSRREHLARAALDVCVKLRGQQWAIDALYDRVRGPRRTRLAVRQFLYVVYTTCGATTLQRRDLSMARVW